MDHTEPRDPPERTNTLRITLGGMASHDESSPLPGAPFGEEFANRGNQID